MEETNLTLDQIIEQSFDFSNYSEEEKKSVIAETSGMIMETSLLRALGDAPEEVQEKFETFIETEPNEESMTLFISENFPNFGEIIVDEIKVFKSMSDDVNTESAAE